MVRRKVEIKKIQDDSKRHVAFSKRRQGLFKKANNLCELCDAQIAIISFSTAGNAYAFGNPTVDSILKRYKAYKAQESSPGRNDNEDKKNQNSPYDEYERTQKPLDDHEKKCDMGLALSLSFHPEEKDKKLEKKESDHEKSMQTQEVDKKVEGHANSRMPSWELPRVDDLEMHELEELVVQIELMKKKVVDRANQTGSIRSTDQVSSPPN